jgi:hypothetical protein
MSLRYIYKTKIPVILNRLTPAPLAVVDHARLRLRGESQPLWKLFALAKRSFVERMLVPQSRVGRGDEITSAYQ